MGFLLCDTLELKAVGFKEVQPQRMVDELLSKAVQPSLSKVTVTGVIRESGSLLSSCLSLSLEISFGDV